MSQIKKFLIKIVLRIERICSLKNMQIELSKHSIFIAFLDTFFRISFRENVIPNVINMGTEKSLKFQTKHLPESSVCFYEVRLRDEERVWRWSSLSQICNLKFNVWCDKQLQSAKNWKIRRSSVNYPHDFKARRCFQVENFNRSAVWKVCESLLREAG